MSEEWGPWIEHDGTGCPCRGMFVNVVFERHPGIFVTSSGIAGSLGGDSWDWSRWLKMHPDGYIISRVVRYRIRKPRGLTILESLLADLPEKVDA